MQVEMLLSKCECILVLSSQLCHFPRLTGCCTMLPAYFLPPRPIDICFFFLLFPCPLHASVLTKNMTQIAPYASVFFLYFCLYIYWNVTLSGMHVEKIWKYANWRKVDFFFFFFFRFSFSFSECNCEKTQMTWMFDMIQCAASILKCFFVHNTRGQCMPTFTICYLTRCNSHNAWNFLSTCYRSTMQQLE